MGWSRGLASGLVVVLACASLASCTGDDEPEPRRPAAAGQNTSTSAEGSSGPTATTGDTAGPASTAPTEALPGTKALSLALTLVPADAKEVVFTDVAAVKKRLGYADLTSQAPTFERFQFWEQARVDGSMLTGTRLYDYSSVMALDFGWTAEDVDWEVAWATDPEACPDPETCADGGYVLGLRRDLDWNVVLNSLADNGYVESSETPGIFATENAAVPFDQVRLLPDIHGLAVGDVALPGDGTDDVPHPIADAFGPLTKRLDVLESVYLRPGCVPLETALGPDANPDDVDAYFKQNDPETLVAPLRWAVGTQGAKATVVLRYETAEAAAADAHPRETIINDWSSLQAGKPFSSVGRAQVRAEGDFAVVDVDVIDPPAFAQMVLTDDAPWALCPATPPR
jgi:hypothetical protein